MATTEHAAEPIQIGELTVTPIAAVNATKLNLGWGGLFKIGARPLRVEVLDRSGRLSSVEIEDVQSKTLARIRYCVIAAAFLSLLTRAAGSARRRESA